MPRRPASPEPEPHAIRVALAHEIAQLILATGLTQKEAAELLGTTQPKVSALIAGKVDGFSLDRLVKYLNLLGEDVHIVVLPKPAAREQAETRVIHPANGPTTGGIAYA